MCFLYICDVPDKRGLKMTISNMVPGAEDEGRIEVRCSFCPHVGLSPEFCFQ